MKNRHQPQPAAPSPIGRLDILLMRLAESAVVKFEQDTGLAGLWPVLAPHAEQFIRQALPKTEAPC